MSNSNRTLSMVKIVDLKSAIASLMLSESNSVAIMALCKEYNAALSSGKHDEQLCEKFVIELSKIAESEAAKDILNSLNESVKKNAKNIKLANNIYSLYNSSCKYIAPMLESYTVDYMVNKTPETRNALAESLSLFSNEPIVKNIIDIAIFEGHDEELGVKAVNAELLESEGEKTPKTYTQSEVDAIIADRVAESKEAEKAAAKKSISMIESHIGLNGAIANILKDNSKNEKLRAFCEQYIAALNSGKSEETLYESFISGISNWNYLSAVDTELSAMNDRISKYKQDIDLKKIVKIMEQTASYYIVPLIEEVVVDYVNDKSMAKRVLLLQRLESFEYDPFVRDIINIVNKDQSLNVGVYLGESLESANKYVHTEEVFSPVLYVKENESIFNVKGTYYKRSGNAISKLSRQEVSNLSESFKNLCALVNSGSVKISEALNTISIYEGSNKAVISESEISINGKKVVPGEIDSLINKASYMNEGSASFYSAVKVLNENFDNIASIDFVKRVASNDRSGKSVDVFKIGNNICVNTIDESLGRSVYYKNVNPIQCKNYINEHMGINITSLFEDVLPDQDNAKKEYEAKKAEYEGYLESLESKKETLTKMKEESSDIEDIDNAIAMIDKEIEDTKADYKKYQEDADKFLNGEEGEDSLKDEVPDSDDDEKSDDDTADKSTDDADDKSGEDSEDKEKESEEDMEQPILGDGGEADVPAEGETDLTTFAEEPDEYADVPAFDPDFDAPAPVVTDTTDTTGGAPATPANANSYEVVRVSYNKNVKTGKLTNKGEVIVVIPSVDANGDVHDDMRKVTFYLDDNNKPVINNEYMPLDMYYSICDAISNADETKTGTFEKDEPDGDQNPSTPTVTPTPEVPAEPSVPDTTPAVPDVPTEPAQSEQTPSDSADASVEPSDESSDTKEGDEAVQQTPAEIQQADSELPQYPITVGLYPDEFAPRGVDEFKKDMDDLKIECVQHEAASDEVCLKISNKAQAHAFKKYFKDWMNYNDEEFDAFCPELVKCFHNKPQEGYPVGPTNESVQIKNVSATNEGKKDVFSILIPATKEYCTLLEAKYDDGFSKKGGLMRVIAENKEEAQYIYNKLYLHSLRNNDVEQDVTDILEHYAPEYKENAEKSVKYSLNVPYNGFLESKLGANGFKVKRIDEGMNVEILSDEFGKAKKVLESFYHDDAPTQAIDFYNHVNEAVHITIKDDTTGKTVEINTDDLNGNESSESKEGEGADYDSSFKDTTFDVKDSLVFNDDEESADEDKDKEKDEEKEKEDKEKKAEEKADESVESTETETGSDDESSDESSDEKEEDKEEKKDAPKKKFKFKATKKNESLEQSADNTLNESAKPTVLDFVSTPAGNGQIIFELSTGNYIVNVSGHTLEYGKNDVKMLRERPDTLDFPWKFDPVTLKALMESYVSCGMFINGARITSDDCKVSLLEYNNAKEDDELNVILEGESTKMLKKYVKITENLCEALDINNYLEGSVKLNLDEGLVDAEAYINAKDFNTYRNINESTYPVRAIVKMNESAKLVYVNGSSISVKGTDDYVPEYVNDLKNAMALTK